MYVCTKFYFDNTRRNFFPWYWPPSILINLKYRVTITFEFTVLAHVAWLYAVRPEKTRLQRLPSRARVARSSRKSEGTPGVEWDGGGGNVKTQGRKKGRGGGKRKCRREAAAGCCRQLPTDLSSGTCRSRAMSFYAFLFPSRRRFAESKNYCRLSFVRAHALFPTPSKNALSFFHLRRPLIGSWQIGFWYVYRGIVPMLIIVRESFIFLSFFERKISGYLIRDDSFFRFRWFLITILIRNGKSSFGDFLWPESFHLRFFFLSFSYKVSKRDFVYSIFWNSSGKNKDYFYRGVISLSERKVEI